MIKLGPGDTIPVINLKKYFGLHRVLVIPQWQREYSWKTNDEGQVSMLLSDLAKFARNNDSNEYLMGSVIMCEQEQEGELAKPLLIDGQQRTLTLTLFLMACSKYMKTKNLINPDKNDHLSLAGDILKCLNQTPYGRFSPRVSMNQSRANEILAELYAWSEITTSVGEDIFKRSDSQTFTQKNLVEVAKYIFDKIVDGEWLTDEEIIPALIKILSGVKFIELTLTDRKESIQVFDRINDRGLVLSSADLIKNILFSEVSDKEFETISENWATMSENLMETKKARLQDPKYLIRVLGMIDDGAHLSYDNLVDHWSRKFADPNDKNTARTFSEDLPLRAQDLLFMVKRKHPDADFGQLSEIFLSSELGSVQHYAVLVAGARIKDKEAFFTLLRQVNMRTILYMFAKERTQTFDLMIPNWAHAVATLGENATKKALIDVYNEHAAPKEELFDSLHDQMEKWRYTSASDRKKIRATLALLSSHMNYACGKPLKIEDSMRTRKARGEAHPWEIEHILPQAIDKSDIYQSIGNLTLLSPDDNRDASDSSTNLKELHYNQCSLVLTKTLSTMAITNATAQKVADIFGNFDLKKNWDLANWDNESVDARFELYFQYLAHLIREVGV